VVGYLDTAYVCPKVLVKGMADKAVIIDLISDVPYFDDQLSEDLIFEFIFVVMYGELPVAFKDKILREIKKEQDIKARVRFIANEIVDFAGKGLVATDMEEMFHIMIARIRMLSEYRLNKHKKFSNRLKLAIAKKWAKKTGKLIMVKPVRHDSVDDMDVIIEKSCDLYFLPGLSDENSSVQVESVSTQTTRELLNIEVMNKLEKQIGVRKVHAVLTLGMLIMVIVLMTLGGRLFTNLFGFIYPCYASFRAIKSDEKEDDTQWLTYWVVFSFFHVFESAIDVAFGWLPLYLFLKLGFLVFCFLPETKGATIVFQTFIEPLFSKAEESSKRFRESQSKKTD